MLKHEAVKICKDCGCEFTTTAHNTKWCPLCRKKPHQSEKKRMPMRKSLRQVMAEIKAYNAEHGTNLSYGQYVSAVERGAI